VQVRRRLYRGRPWYVLHDPLANQFARLHPISYHFISLLDGRRTVEQAWELTLERHGDDAPTQNEVIGLLGQLNESNLLRGNLPPDAQPLVERHRRKRLRRAAGQAMSVLFVQIPLFNPHRVLQVLEPLFRPLLNRWGLLLWLGWLIFCGSVFLPHMGEYVRQSTDLLASPANWGWLLVIFLAVKVLHELGHGLVCERLGGPVYEGGIMILVLFPAPYMDTTSAWSFESKWHRFIVGAAGMIFELAIAGAAALAWVYTSDDLVRQLAHHMVLVTTIATVLFNANPLMRFDGYFMLSDLLEVPNLYERATQQLKWLCQRGLFGLKNALPPSTNRREQVILFTYGVLALLYRVLIMVSIVTFIAGFAFTLGLALAAWTMFMWLVMPAGKFAHWLTTSAALHRNRSRAVMVTAALVLAIGFAVGGWPAPDRRRAVGVIEAAQRAEVTIQTPGFVQQVYVQSGQWLEEGTLILTADNPAMRARIRELEAEIANLLISQRDPETSPTHRLMYAAQLETQREDLQQVREQLEALSIRASRTGLFVAPPLHMLEGRFINRGESLGQIIEPQSLRVTALVDQAQNSLVLLNQIERVELRIVGQAERMMESRLLRAFDSGRSRLPHSSLGTSGGGPIAMDPDDPHGQTTLRPYFHLWLALPEGEQVRVWPGQRIVVRFTLSQRRPLASQWLDRVMQVFDPRLAL